MKADAPALLADNVNHWFQETPERRMIRTLDGQARAFLSDRYHRIDNERIADAVLPVLVADCGHGAVVSCCITDSKLYLQALFPRLEGEVKTGDPVQGGVIISNGEIGNGALDMRIPRKLDSHSMANWTPVPRQSGQSERSDAGVESVYSWMGSSVNGGWNLRRDSPTRGSGWA
jgi:hypothetical protein